MRRLTKKEGIYLFLLATATRSGRPLPRRPLPQQIPRRVPLPRRGSHQRKLPIQHQPQVPGRRRRRAHLLWGVEATDAAVLGKFLKVKRYKVHDAFTALRRTLRWRTDFRPVDEDLAPPLDNAWFASGVDKEGRPLCCSVLGREYQRNLMSMGQQGCHKYLRWRLLCVEKGIRRLNFWPGGVDSIVQIVDMRHAGGPTTKEMKLVGKKMIALLHDHYPGIVHKNLIINEPSWYLTLKALKLRLVTKRSKNKFIFVKQSRVTETLVNYASIENILVQYGGLRRENDTEFTTEDKVLEAYIRANGTELIQIPVEVIHIVRVQTISYQRIRKRYCENMSSNMLARKEIKIKVDIKKS
ncbi:hypothetical protein SASPL_137739 [Salvia splendens]|uniref:CRAL-TRIO domain-containing protein n=1 Tax=Salvia splendens TaxID=180675 RepID=A0A8X8WU72_SALSN|nr:hypothetical protein SASPL_137739 [Salvia splendens]